MSANLINSKSQNSNGCFAKIVNMIWIVTNTEMIIAITIMKRIIKFEKNNCQPCDTVGKILDEMGVTYERVNAFDNPDVAAKHRVMTLPTVVVLDDDKEVTRIKGVNREQLSQVNFW